MFTIPTDIFLTGYLPIVLGVLMLMLLLLPVLLQLCLPSFQINKLPSFTLGIEISFWSQIGFNQTRYYYYCFCCVISLLFGRVTQR